MKSRVKFRPVFVAMKRRGAPRIFSASVDAVFPGANKDETEEKNQHLSRAGPFNKLTSCLIKEDRCHNEIECHQDRDRTKTKPYHDEHAPNGLNHSRREAPKTGKKVYSDVARGLAQFFPLLNAAGEFRPSVQDHHRADACAQEN
jgi:hypothetical protein